MPRFRSEADRRATRQSIRAMLTLAGIAALLLAVGAIYLTESTSRQALDEVTLCPPKPVSTTVLLVDVTDPMNVAQRQDFFNQLEQLKASIPRYGKLTVIKVDSAAERLLSPVIVRCNPGTAADVSGFSGNPKSIEEKHRRFEKSLDTAFETLTRASGAEVSPILESIQSAALTELRSRDSTDGPRRLIVASDLLQNTKEISFYGPLPDTDRFLAGGPFRKARTDLRGVEVELWMLQRSDSGETQPRALAELWAQIIEAQGGTFKTVYRVSG
jgi:hypothetical protein